MRGGTNVFADAITHSLRFSEHTMDFGLQFFPCVASEDYPADGWFMDALQLVEDGEPLGYTHVRIVEHYFHRYGGLSPNPLVFLAAAAQRTKTMRLITGAVLPIFNNPLKLAGEIGMVDAISGGRLEVGFARAFLPHEFRRFGISLDESRERFDEGFAIVGKLLEEEQVTSDGRFTKFPETTSLPRPTQKPRPPFWIAALATESSFENAGRLGHSVMAIPLATLQMRKLIDIYRNAWREAGHVGTGRVMLAFHMFCHADRDEAIRIARRPLNNYLKSIVEAASDWTTGVASKDYAGYDKIIAKLAGETIESQMASGAALIGSPDDIARQINQYLGEVGAFEIASLQVNFGDLDYQTAAPSMRLFAHEVLPRFAQLPLARSK